jgi:5-methylcytosine-specific restriction endonuclease McrA
MNPKKLDSVEVWKQLEDVLAPRFKLSVLDRAVYSHLLRHSFLEGKLRLRFSIVWLANNLGITSRRARQSVRRLIDIGALHLIERSNIGHVVDVRLPQQLCAAHSSQSAPACSLPSSGANLEKLDFWRTRPLRLAIHAREAGLCFYCLRQTPTRDHCLDHVVPVAKDGTNSYRNLVSCCMDCNSRKRDLSATDFLRSLYREGELSRKELTARLAALRSLAAGKLRPRFSTGEDSGTAPATVE